MQVKAVNPKKNCQACMAAQRALENGKFVLSKAVSKIKYQAQAIEDLEKQIKDLENEN